MTKKIVFDGLNLALPQGTGIATYTRSLIQAAQSLGHGTGVLYSVRRSPAKDPALREIGFFDERRRGFSESAFSRKVRLLKNVVSSLTTNHATALGSAQIVDTRQFKDKLPQVDSWMISKDLFVRAHIRFDTLGNFLPIDGLGADIFHCTYQLPISARRAANVVTIHDLVSLRLPFTTADSKRRSYRLLQQVARKADHIVTVSESSRRDIVELLGVDETRVTNTFQAVSFPPQFLSRTNEDIAEQLSGSLGLEWQNYLLFFGAMEPKKNIPRIVEAYLASSADIPLVLITSQGWENELEIKILEEQLAKQKRQDFNLKRRIIRFEYVSRSMLICLLRGARALLFPSLYEGFGLPVLEAMTLGTPVITSRTSSLPEVAGPAGFYVDPYDIENLANAITTITLDKDLREDLIVRGKAQADQFSFEKYRERLSKLYNRIG